jgi:hypothetical protein
MSAPMEEEKNNQNALQEMTLKLKNLSPLLPTAGNNAKEFFDDFVREHEWELALHVVCDHLLEPATKAAPINVIEEIGSLHKVMGLADNCAAALRRKAGHV